MAFIRGYDWLSCIADTGNASGSTAGPVRGAARLFFWFEFRAGHYARGVSEIMSNIEPVTCLDLTPATLTLEASACFVKCAEKPGSAPHIRNLYAAADL